ncbi:CoA transferase subunit A [bacterium]|nr:CoA transferase subunit A [bacterium]
MDKQITVAEAVALVKDHYHVMIGGFGVPGTPMILVDALLKQNTRHLTLIKNEANIAGIGVSKLVENGQVDSLVTSHLGLNSVVLGMMNRKEINVEFNPQGILAERIRCGGAGLLGFITDIGIDTILRENKQVIKIGERTGILETSLRADVALIHAAIGDRFGNLVYEKSARNFNPAMATAARIVIAEVEKLVEPGELQPDSIHTPGAFVDHMVVIDELTAEYGILEDYVIG